MPYPSSSQFTGGQHSPKSSDHNPTLAADLVALRSNDRIQDSRLDHLERGQRVAPTPTVTEPVQTTRLTYEKHQVRARESIWGIADRYGVTAEDIRKTNSRRTDFITEGEILYIPQRVSASTNTLAGTQPRGKVKPIRSSKSTHIVQRGETLSTIAAAYGVSAKSLQSTNGIRNPNVIALGQKLAIPGSSNGARTAQPLATSAKPQRAAAPAPKAATAAVVVIAPEPLTPGSGTAIGSAVKPVGLRGITSYRVEVGDNVDSVAKTFGITPAELRRINRVDQLPPTGEEIAVPLPGSVAL